MEVFQTQATAVRNDQHARNPALWAAAKSLEASFLSEMLESAGYGAARDSFGGGAGEEQFSSLLIQEQSVAIVEQGGIGLARSIYESLVRGGNRP